MKWLDRLLLRRADEPSPAVVGDPDRVLGVEAVLAELRPMFRADGGDIELVSVADGWVEVRLAGACKTCHASDLTLFAALEPRLRERFLWFRGIRAG